MSDAQRKEYQDAVIEAAKTLLYRTSAASIELPFGEWVITIKPKEKYKKALEKSNE